MKYLVMKYFSENAIYLRKCKQVAKRNKYLIELTMGILPVNIPILRQIG